MIITIYKCDLCKNEYREAKDIYEAKNGISMAIKSMLQSNYKLNEMCKECFDKIQFGLHNLIEEIKK